MSYVSEEATPVCPFVLFDGSDLSGIPSSKQTGVASSEQVVHFQAPWRQPR